MSFDLNFCRNDKTVLTIEELVAYFEHQPFFKTNHDESGGVNFWYNNEATGVYCNFSYEPNGEADPELGECARAGLSFNLNYLRPSFFAYETMPLVGSFCRHFQLRVEDPQAETVGEASTTSLINSWRNHNSSAVAMVTKQTEVALDLHYFPEERATAWWGYMREKHILEAQISEDIFVPSIFLLATPDNQLITMIGWPHGIAQLFPKCDFVFVERTKKKLFGEKKETGFVPYSEALSLIDSYLDNYKTLAGPVRYLPAAKMMDVVPLLKHLKLRPAELNTYTAVTPDSFHDVELPIA